MRINRYIALATGMSRRVADQAIDTGRVRVNGVAPKVGQQIRPSDEVALDNLPISTDVKGLTIILNKPVGYVCSRDGQGSKTIYDLLPPELHSLKPAGRLDKDSSGLILLTNDGQLAHQLTHPSFEKEKVYEVILNKPLEPEDKLEVEKGVMLEDGLSSLQITVNSQQQETTISRQLSAVSYIVRMTEGRNRQIRRTFGALGYKVTSLHRTQFGDYKLGTLQSGKYIVS